jgi:hypothetical protein
MIFSGSVSSGFSFTIAGDPVIGSESQSVDLSSSESVGNGTAAGQAQVGWATVVSIPANSVLSIDLRNADASVLGLLGVVRFTEIRAARVRNTETSTAKVALVGCPSAGTDTTAWAARVAGGGRWEWSNFSLGDTVDDAGRYFTVTNPGASAVIVEVGFIGLGSFVDT